MQVENVLSIWSAGMESGGVITVSCIVSGDSAWISIVWGHETKGGCQWQEKGTYEGY